MKIEQNVSLKPFNTFGIEAKSSHFVDISSTEELVKLQKEKIFQLPRIVLGGGSNVLFTEDYEGLIIKISSKGIETLQETSDNVIIKVQAGEVWHDLVLNCIGKGWAGIENMSLIPGTVGAAPMQNIGAYGVEIKEVFVSLEAMEIETGQFRTFKKEECEFGYRWSIFKGALKNRYIITSVTLKLEKKPSFITDYGDIKNTLQEMGVTELSIKAVSDAVIKIRQSKLPNPAEIGNAGSFFKNPEIPTSKYNELKSKFPEMPGYKVSEEMTKVPAGWLIEQAGWKGYTRGNIGVHKNQALVLVNYGNGNGKALVDLAFEIKKSVAERFEIEINPEVNIY